jgi:serine/threonine protein kinase
MAEIFLAMEHKIEGVKRQVVVKRVLPQMLESDDFVTMFNDEARLATRFSHPNVAHVYNFGEVQGIYFLAMEFVDGLTVSRLVRLMKDQRIPIPMTLRIMADACSGLHYAHEIKDDKDRCMGVVHRDVSPQNIMVSRTGVAKLLDFGVAHASTQVHHTAVGQLKGKLAYMSPEQFRGDGVDRRADVFAAGVVLYEMISGKPLFRRENEAATMHALIYEDPPSVAEFGAPPELDEIIAKACAKDIEKRYQTSEDMQEAIEELAVATGQMVTGKMLGRFVEEGMAMVAEAKASAKRERTIPDLTPSHISIAKFDHTPPQLSGLPVNPANRPTPYAKPGRGPIPLPPPARPPQTPGGPPPLPQRSEPPPPLPTSVPQMSPPPVAFSLSGPYPSSPSITTPGPASDVATRERGRGLLIGLVGVLILVVLSIGGVLIWQLASEANGNDRHQASLGQNTAGLTNPPTHDAGPTKAAIPTTTVDAGGGDVVPLSSLGDASPMLELTSPGDAGPNESADHDGEAENGEDEEEQEPRERQYGTLFVNTTPWSKVRAAGRDLGNTPVVGAKVPAGNLTLILVDGEGNTIRHRVVVRPNQPSKVYINLRTANQ